MKKILTAFQKKRISRIEQKEAKIRKPFLTDSADSEGPSRVYIEPASFLEKQHLIFKLHYFIKVMPKTSAYSGFLGDLETFARAAGADAIGYAKLEPQYLFQGKGILYTNAVVLVKSMDKKIMASSPSKAAYEMIMETYADLGDTANRVADFLRDKGYGAQASHALGGSAVYPVLGQKAGLGYVGGSGILISPEFGPCQRLAAVFTSIENLPFPHENPHAWIEDYCRTCDICMRICPGQAIFRDPVIHANGSRTYIDKEKCFPYFYKYHGCSWCIRECPFTITEYDILKKDFFREKDPFLHGRSTV